MCQRRKDADAPKVSSDSYDGQCRRQPRRGALNRYNGSPIERTVHVQPQAARASESPSSPSIWSTSEHRSTAKPALIHTALGIR